MIYNEMTNLTPMPLCGMAITTAVFSVNGVEPQFISNCCFSCECEECYPVFVGDEDWQNEKTTFAFIKTISTDTFSFKVYKDNILKTTITDNTYGDLVSSYATNTKQYSFVLDWKKIYVAFGRGSYTVKNDYTIMGVSKTYTSQKFCVTEYDCKEANGWIKLEWTQKGNIESNEFKFCTPLNHCIKIKGWLDIQAPKTVEDTYRTSTREVKTFRKEQINNYLLNFKLIRENMLSLFNENMVLSDKILLTDYNDKGTNWIQRELKFIEFGDLNDFTEIDKIDFTMSFQDFKQNIIKNNCC